nr:unnamed protein product [Callosobruchus chinensis]
MILLRTKIQVKRKM